jgi:RNA polymerase sigma-70 factor, ECF subfamily
MALFVELHADAVYRFLYHRLDRPEVLDDLVQEVFLAAWVGLASFRGESEVRTWLLGIARHKVADHYRSRLASLEMREGEDPAEIPDALVTLPQADERLDAARVEARARQVLATLPDAYRAVLVWRYWDERPLSEIAEITGHTEKSVERLLARARGMFKRRWRDA